MKLKLYFVFGKSSIGMDDLEKELIEFDDLIIANFSDEYNNLPLKVNKLHIFNVINFRGYLKKRP